MSECIYTGPDLASSATTKRGHRQERFTEEVCLEVLLKTIGIWTASDVEGELVPVVRGMLRKPALTQLSFEL